jgi:hypothetical protein
MLTLHGTVLCCDFSTVFGIVKVSFDLVWSSRTLLTVKDRVDHLESKFIFHFYDRRGVREGFIDLRRRILGGKLKRIPIESDILSPFHVRHF